MTVDAAGTETASSPVRPSTGWVGVVERESGQPVSRCYQCQKCSGGCPLSFAMDVLPHQLLRYVQFGLRDRVYQSRTVWLCAACRTCGARCPNGIDIAAVADAIKQEMLRQGLPAKESQIQAFHQTFLSSLQSNGRLHELSMLVRYKLRSGNLTQDLDLGLAMLRRGKLKLWPEGVRRKREIQALFARAREGSGHAAV
ncbi:MAG: 4Fe-4S dicluster domain-containing protein [Moorellales bacterium]